MSQLQTLMLYGLKTDVFGNAHFVDDEEIAYLVGNVLALHNFSQRRQRLIRLSDKRRINIMTIAPNKKYVALCEMGEKPLISIYDLLKLKKKKLLGIPFEVPGVTKFACLSFTFDSKHLVAVSGEPNQTMLFYNWEKGKVESSLEVGNSQNSAAFVDCVACNPVDLGIVAIGGKYVFKFLTVSETVWRPYGFSKADNLLITSLIWINNDRLLASIIDGRIMYLENGDLKYIFNMTDTVHMNLKIKEEYVVQNVSHENEQSENKHEIHCLINFPRGFAFDLGLGKVIVFEKDGQHKYSKRHVYTVPQQVSKEKDDHLYKINSISVSLNNHKLIVTTGWSQLFYTNLWDSNLKTEIEPIEMKVMGHHLHHGPIGGISKCIWKSHFMTFGEIDRSVRIWDFETASLIMMKQYSEDVFSVVLHPTGLFCLIGFSDKLRFMNIFINDLLTMHEFKIKNCKTATFSNGGHLFSAVNGNIIEVYSAINFEQRFLLKGHTGIIKEVVWSANDVKFVSMGSEGAIYEWDSNSGKRISEVVIKGVTLNGIILSSDGLTIYCISSDSRIHEIRDNEVIRVYNTPGITPLKIIQGKNESLIFVIHPGGHIASLQHPLYDPVEYTNYHGHSIDICQIILTQNEKTLISAGIDGTLCFWKIANLDKPDVFEQKYIDHILIHRGNIAENLQMIKDLRTRIKELETEQAYVVRKMTIENQDKVAEIHHGYCEVIEELRNKIDKLEEDHINEINAINVEVVKMKAIHEEGLRQTEISYDSKLIIEYEKYNSFEKHNNEMRQDYEKQISEILVKDEEKLEKITDEFKAQIQEKDLQLKEIHEEMLEQTQIHENIKLQIEDDADREIIELRTNYESILYGERQTILKLKGEAGVLRNKHITNQKDIEDLNRQFLSLQNEHLELQNRKLEVDKEVLNLKKDIKDINLVILQKESYINELIKLNDELEKYKFVLNHNIEKLNGQIEPRDAEIRELKEKISDMETELLNLNKFTQGLHLKITELKEKLISTKKELLTQQSLYKQCQKSFRKIRVAVLEAANLINEPNELKNKVIKLYQIYSDDIEFKQSHQADLDAQREFMKQRDHLEKTIALLKKQLSHSSSGGDGNFNKILEENIMLLMDINSLREELRSAQYYIAEMESLLGVKKKDTGPSEVKSKIAKACQKNEELELNYKKKMLECQQVILLLKQDLERLINSIGEQKSKE